MKNKKRIINIICVVIALVVICLVIVLAIGFSKKGKSKVPEDFGVDSEGNKMYEISKDIDYENAEVSTIKFKLKNNLEKDINKIYIRDNTDENFSREICDELKAGEEKELEYGNYSPVFIWDLKIVTKDGEEKTLNSLLAANILYDGAILELNKSGEDNIEAINPNMDSAERQEKTEESEGNVEEAEESTNNEEESQSDENNGEEQAQNNEQENVEEN